MRLTDPLYAVYSRRLRRRLRGEVLPRHIGPIMDCEALWAAFREVDFLRALRKFANRHRRFGS